LQVSIYICMCIYICIHTYMYMYAKICTHKLIYPTSLGACWNSSIWKYKICAKRPVSIKRDPQKWPMDYLVNKTVQVTRSVYIDMFSASWVYNYIHICRIYECILYKYVVCVVRIYLYTYMYNIGLYFLRPTYIFIYIYV